MPLRVFRVEEAGAVDGHESAQRRPVNLLLRGLTREEWRGVAGCAIS